MERPCVLNCETCGGPLTFSADGLSAVCPYCGNEYKFTGGKSEALTLALNRANALRINCDFDGAIREYKLITERNPQDAEAYWGLALSTYGIEYVPDSRTGRRVPTCRRTVKKSILEDENYQNALRYADGGQAEAYRSRAAVIDRLQRDIKRKMEEEEDFDVFLSFRSADENGAPTRERTVARRIYDELTRRSIKTFYSEVTLKDRLGDDFEPIIFKALYSCKFFILIAFSEENISSPWVKNEWSRFRDREREEHLSGACCAVFDGISPSSLPPFLRSQQGINLSKYPAGGYEIELADSLQARFSRPSGAVRKAAKGTASVLHGAQIDLEDGIYDGAREKFLRVLDEDPECAEAWWGLFLAGRNSRTSGLAAQNMTYESAATLKDDRNLKNAERFGDTALREKVATFRKMCVFRGGELAADCDVKTKNAQRRLSQIEAERKKEAGKRDSAMRRLEKSRKTVSANPKIMLRLMGIVIVIWLVLFAILFAATGEDVLLYVGIGMTVMCALAMLMSYFGMKSNVQRAKQQITNLEGEAEHAEERLEELGREAAECEREIALLKRQAETFRNVFRV